MSDLLTGPFHFWRGPTIGDDAAFTFDLTGTEITDTVTASNTAGFNNTAPFPPQLIPGTPWKCRVFNAYLPFGEWMGVTYIQVVRGARVAHERFVVCAFLRPTEEASWTAAAAGSGVNYYLTGPMTNETAVLGNFVATLPLAYHYPTRDAADSHTSIKGGTPAVGLIPENYVDVADGAPSFNYTITERGGSLPPGTYNNGTVEYRRNRPGSASNTHLDSVQVFVNYTGAGAVPSIVSGDATGTVGKAFSYAIIATNSPTSYGATGLPTGLSVNTSTGVISGTPYSALDNRTVTLTATNAAGTGTASIQITIGYPPPIFVDAPYSVNAYEGQLLDWQQGTTAGVVVTTFGALPSWLVNRTIDSMMRFQGYPPIGTAGQTFVVSLRGTLVGTDETTLTIHVLAPPAPVVTGHDVAGFVDEALAYQIAATGTPTGYGATGLPAGLTVNTATGAITGTPNAAGVSVALLKATNTGGTGQANATFTISAAPGSDNPNMIIQVDLNTSAVTLPKPLTIPHGSQVIFEVQFLPAANAGTITGTGVTIKEKVAAGLRQYPELLRIDNTAGAVAESGGATFLCGPLNIDSPALNQSLTLLDAVDPSLSVEYSGEVHFTWNGRRRFGALFAFTVSRELSVLGYTADPGAPSSIPVTSGMFSLSAVTGLTGGGPTNLDGTYLTGVPIDTLVLVDLGEDGGLQIWKVITDDDVRGEGTVVTVDSLTSNKVLRRRS